MTPHEQYGDMLLLFRLQSLATTNDWVEFIIVHETPNGYVNSEIPPESQLES